MTFGWHPYDDNYWCTHCGTWIPQEESKGDPPQCPECSHKLRTVARENKYKKDKPYTEAR